MADKNLRPRPSRQTLNLIEQGMGIFYPVEFGGVLDPQRVDFWTEAQMFRSEFDLLLSEITGLNPTINIQDIVDQVRTWEQEYREIETADRPKGQASTTVEGNLDDLVAQYEEKLKREDTEKVTASERRQETNEFIVGLQRAKESKARQGPGARTTEVSSPKTVPSEFPQGVYLNTQIQEPSVVLTDTERSVIQEIAALSDEVPAGSLNQVLVQEIETEIRKGIPISVATTANPQVLDATVHLVATNFIEKVVEVKNHYGGVIPVQVQPPIRQSTVFAQMVSPKKLVELGHTEQEAVEISDSAAITAQVLEQDEQAAEQLLVPVFGKKVFDVIYGTDSAVELVLTSQPTESTVAGFDHQAIISLKDQILEGEQSIQVGIATTGIAHYQNALLTAGVQRRVETPGDITKSTVTTQSIFNKTKTFADKTHIFDQSPKRSRVEEYLRGRAGLARRTSLREEILRHITGSTGVNFPLILARPILSEVSGSDIDLTQHTTWPTGGNFAFDFLTNKVLGKVGSQITATPLWTKFTGILTKATGITTTATTVATATTTGTATAAATTAVATTATSATLATVFASIASIVPFIGTIVGAIVGYLLPRIISFIKENATLLLSIALGMLAVGSVPLVIGGVILGGTTIALSGLAIGNAIRLGLGGIGRGMSFAFRRLVFPSIIRPAIVIFIVIPIFVALSLFIINSGAYIVPPGGSSGILPNTQSDYIGVTKIPDPPGPFENSALRPLTINYTVTVTAKRGILSDIRFSNICNVVNRTGWTPNCDVPIPTTIPTEIAPAQPFVFNYTMTYESSGTNPGFEDSFVSDTFKVTADAPGHSDEVTATTATIKIGNPPEQCPSGWPVKTDVGQKYYISQGPYAQGSHHIPPPGVEAIDVRIDPESRQLTRDDLVVATHVGTVAAAGTDDNGGLWVDILGNCNGQPYISRHVHFSDYYVGVGDQVVPGTILGMMGMTGIARGPHDHYEFRVDTNAGSSGNPPVKMINPYIPIPSGVVLNGCNGNCGVTIP